MEANAKRENVYNLQKTHCSIFSLRSFMCLFVFVALFAAGSDVKEATHP